MTVNETFLLLDFLVQATCMGGPTNDPPISPTNGDAYICGSAPTNEWQGHPKSIASWSESGWRFAIPIEGMKLTDRSSGKVWHFRQGEWVVGVIVADEVRIADQKVVGMRQPAINAASGGTVVDQEGRAVIAAILGALRSHGLIEA
jgi:hypothetical protein